MYKTTTCLYVSNHSDIIYLDNFVICNELIQAACKPIASLGPFLVLVLIWIQDVAHTLFRAYNKQHPMVPPDKVETKLLAIYAHNHINSLEIIACILFYKWRKENVVGRAECSRQVIFYTRSVAKALTSLNQIWV